MRKRPLGKTTLQVSELALGTWGLSGDGYGPISSVEVDRVIDRALAVGIDLFDTADVYGRGEMERCLGKRLQGAGATFVVTKIGTDLDELPPKKRFDPAHLRTAFERSQERLARDVVDVVLLHNPTVAAMRSKEPLDFLKELKQAGKIRAFGVSAGSADVARAALRDEVDVIELAYNALLPGDLHEVAGDVSESGAGVLARSVLAHGLLAGHWSPDRDFYPDDHRAQRWTRDEFKTRLRQLDALRPLVTGNVVSLRAAALRFVLANHLVSSAVLGPRSVAQLDQLVREAGMPPYLRDTALTDLSARLKNLGVTT
ncbi:oxidoreductase/voltage-gated potassium channel beta-1 subunit [Sorangium cellulosum]|uniref:Oxidoreductase/voltage-gated potassium channel beta-1 subunit n=1 Tax=Sorangium cellulosum TaxID=56 RepID=A0A2L0EJS7_SORCE|nr:aldo/keto reductase [Sorangium cellulosum]AUX39562.1 oxidoreductase/voltage-gated potassium channel beta-1 subunit [Sorangium cellulosum]